VNQVLKSRIILDVFLTFSQDSKVQGFTTKKYLATEDTKSTKWNWPLRFYGKNRRLKLAAGREKYAGALFLPAPFISLDFPCSFSYTQKTAADFK